MRCYITDQSGRPSSTARQFPDTMANNQGKIENFCTKWHSHGVGRWVVPHLTVQKVKWSGPANMPIFCRHLAHIM